MRVLHFVTGGFSGATQVAVDLCLAAQRSGDMQVLLVLRRKRNTDAARVQALRDQGLDVRVVPGWSHMATVLALRRIALEWQPGILVAHGFSEHLWGRYAGLLAKVPKLVHVEHNPASAIPSGGWRRRVGWHSARQRSWACPKACVNPCWNTAFPPNDALQSLTVSTCGVSQLLR